MIGYILLISMAIMMSIIVYQWVKTYVPQDSIECQDGVSLFIQGYSYNCTNQNFDLTLKNNGRFDLAGYFVHVTDAVDEELAVEDISQLNEDVSKRGSGSVSYPPLQGDINPISAGDTFSDSFNLSSVGQIYSLEIVPLRQETINNRNRAVSCTNARIQEPIQCGDVGQFCDEDGVKEQGEECDGSDLGTPAETCQDLGFTGGTLSCNNKCQFVTTSCTAAGCGNGILEGSEKCDDGNAISTDGCNACQITFGWGCSQTLPSVCDRNYTSLFFDGFTTTNPLSSGWSSPSGTDGCPGNCGGSNTSDISASNSNSCGLSGCGFYYMTTRDERASIKTINTEGYQNINLSYFRRTNPSSGSDIITSQWRIGNTGTWNTLESSNPTATWAFRTYSLSGANDKPEIQIRFWRSNSQDDEYSWWDSVNISGQVV